jgi:hypothetical protein
MKKTRFIYIFIGLVTLTNSFFSQTQDPPSEEDLMRHIVKRQISDISDSKRWEVKVEYPELRLDGDKPAEGFNNHVKLLAKKQYDDFLKTMSEFSDEDRKLLPEGVSYSMNVGYSLEFLNDELISISFGRSDYTGGAHPNHWSFTVNYDLKNEKVLKLTDLFKDESGFLKVISGVSIEQLTKKMGEYADSDWIKEGAGPKLENFESWNISKKGLKFFFDPYQVGPYAAGGFETIVPFEKFTIEMQSDRFYNVSKVSYVDGSPPNICRNGLFTSQETEFGLAKVKGEKNQRTYFYNDDKDCPSGKNCQRKSYLISGDEVITSKSYGNFVCVWFQPGKGTETVGWLPAENLSSITSQNTSGINWIGNWEYAENEINFIPQKNQEKVLIKGTAIWQGLGDNVHIGELDFTGSPVGEKLEAGSGSDKYDCQVKMKRIGKYLLVADNKMCGGMNVSFDGIYRRKK